MIGTIFSYKKRKFKITRANDTDYFYYNLATGYENNMPKDTLISRISHGIYKILILQDPFRKTVGGI